MSCVRTSKARDIAWSSAAPGSEALGVVRQTQPRCLILDVMLPGKDGFEICAEIRRAGSIVPILFLSARADEPDRVDGLRVGADDYLVKPFSPRELLARVDALLRRAEIGPQPPTVLRLGNVELSPTRHDVAVDGRHVALTHVEFGLLAAMLERPGWVLTRGQLIDRLYTDDRLPGAGTDRRRPRLPAAREAARRARERRHRDHSRRRLQDHRRGRVTWPPCRRAGASCAAWRALGLRWQLVVLNVVVIAVTVVLIIVLMHNIAQQQFMVIMHAAGQPVDPAAGQRAYDAAVEAQIYPTIAVAALVAVALSFAAVTFALRPLTAVREATRRMARGDAPAPVATSRRDEIGGVADSVNELAQSLQRLEELRRQVTNDAAHELRTPLHNLLGLIEGMRDGVIPASPARLQQAHTELDRLIALVEDLRGLADAQLAPIECRASH